MRFTGLTLSALLFAGTVLAQGTPQSIPGAGRPAVQALKDYLSLSDAQVTSLTSVETALRAAIKPLVQDLAAKRQALRAENQKTTPDPNVIAQLNQDIASLLGQVEAERATYQKQALSNLTADQLAQLDKLSQVLQLVLVARAAAALDLINPPAGAGGGIFGLGGRAGARAMMRRPPAQ